MVSKQAEYEKYTKKKKLTDKIFMAVIILLFLAFLILTMMVEALLPRYITGALLIAVALIYKKVEKTMKGKEEELSKFIDSESEME